MFISAFQEEWILSKICRSIGRALKNLFQTPFIDNIMKHDVARETRLTSSHLRNIILFLKKKERSSINVDKSKKDYEYSMISSLESNNHL